ncbi:nucleotidyltransferase domain-containing protein [Desulfobacula sp.]|uniref:nucleotidyltransferase family protein n=1 Tax=Desulfobacula sp. TaxID=2593537 RepID=UPI00260638C7|nr:nucleotidyltransferase domain-containing protein [Desulfobacula sp.]
MGKKDIIEILRNYKNEVANQYNILTIGVFGSVARGESGDESDVDIVIRISETDFFMLAGMKEDLEKRLNKSIDIITYTDSMNPFLKNRIDHKAVYA